MVSFNCIRHGDEIPEGLNLVKLRYGVPLRLLIPMILATVFCVAGLLAMAIENKSLHQAAILDAKAKADLILARDQAISAFITNEVTPNLQPGNMNALQAGNMDVVSAAHTTMQIDHYFTQAKPADTYIKEVSVNARLFQNEADSIERAYLEKVNSSGDRSPESFVMTIDGNPYYVVMKPSQITQASCLTCHGDPKNAPQAVIDAFGPTKSFNWKVGDVASITSVRVSLAGPYKTADNQSFRTSILLAFILIGVFLAQVILTRRLLLDPIEQIQDAATRIANDENRLGDQVSGRFGSELMSLAQAFNQMSANLRRMRNSLEERVQDRTAKLSQANTELEHEVDVRLQAEQELDGQRILAEALRDTSLALNSTLDLQGVIHRILVNLNRVIPHDAANVMVVEDGVAQVVDCQGYETFGVADFVRSIRWVVADVANYKQMAKTGLPVLTPDTRIEAGWVRPPEMEWLRSYIGAPIMLKGNLVGFINIDSSTPGLFDKSQLDTMQIFASQAATAIGNAHTYDSLRQYSNEISSLYYASDVLLATGKGVEKLAQQIIHVVIQQFTTSYATLLIGDEEQNELKLVAEEGTSEEEWAPLNLKGFGITVRAYRDSQVQYVPDVRNDPDYVPWNLETRTELAIPLIAGDRTVGVLNVESPNVDAFSERWRHVLVTYASRAALAIENAQLQTEIKQFAITDPLTGLYNRRGLEELFKHEIERANRLNQPLSVLMIDVDHFKQINDNFGHPAGDQVLATIAERLKTTLRKMDIFGRIGGDEFIILLPGIGEDGIETVGNRLRQDLEQTPIEAGHEKLKATISIGAASLPKGMTNIDEVIMHADAALLAAKHAGRNQSHIWKGEEDVPH